MGGALEPRGRKRKASCDAILAKTDGFGMASVTVTNADENSLGLGPRKNGIFVSFEKSTSFA